MTEVHLAFNFATLRTKSVNQQLPN